MVRRVPDGSLPPADQLPLIRYSHIFSSAVREFLEEKLLPEASTTITPRQLQLLRFIAVGHHHIDEVAKFLGISAPAATKAVDKLERRGLVLRMASPADRRLKVLSCSLQGRELVARYQSLEAKRLGPILSTFSEGEITDLANLLERYSLALIAIDASNGVPCFRCAGYFDAECPVQFVHANCPYRQRSEEER